MTAQEFFDKWNGKGIDFDNYYGFQCMDLAEEYNQDVVGAPRLGGNAVDVWNSFPADFYEKIENTPDGVPSLGDIVIWGQGVGQFGHIAVFKEGDTNQFTSFDQNWPLGSVCHFQSHNYNNVIGWLHCKATLEPTVPVPSSKFEELVNKSTKYDEFVKAGFNTIDDVNKRIDDLQKEFEDYKTSHPNSTVTFTVPVESSNSAMTTSTTTPIVPTESTNPQIPSNQPQTDFFTSLFLWIKSWFKK